MRPPLDINAVVLGEVDELPSLATNVRSMSASTGIPEETVRRKVRALVEEGLIKRRDRALTYTPKAVRAMEGVRRILIGAADQNHRLVSQLLGEAR